jgi:hypothetical protein
VSKPQHIKVGSGLAGDRGAMTLSLPNQRATLELWKKSPEFCALRSLTNVALAQHLLHLSKPANLACSALAGFYSRSLAEKLPGSVNPCLEVSSIAAFISSQYKPSSMIIAMDCKLRILPFY